MRGLQNFCTLVGRIFLSLLFIFSAIDKLWDWQNSEGGLVSLFCDWHTSLNQFPVLQDIFASLLLWVPYILAMIVILEFIGGLMLLFGIKPRLAVVLILIFFIPSTILLHHFWFLPHEKRELEFAFFMKNVAIIGGLLIVLADGAKLKKKPPKIELNIPKNNENK